MRFWSISLRLHFLATGPVSPARILMLCRGQQEKAEQSGIHTGGLYYLNPSVNDRQRHAHHLELVCVLLLYIAVHDPLSAPLPIPWLVDLAHLAPALALHNNTISTTARHTLPPFLRCKHPHDLICR